MTLDHTVYPDLETPPETLTTPADQADYVHRICSAFDFGIFPEESDWELFRGWKDVFDRYPLPHSPAWHTFRTWFGWEDGPRPDSPSQFLPGWKLADLREGREDPCEGLV